MSSFLKQHWRIILTAVIILILIIFFPKIFLTAGITIIAGFLSVAAFLFTRRRSAELSKKEQQSEGRPMQQRMQGLWPLPDGVQVAIFVTTLLLLFILRDKQKFATDIWEDSTVRFWFITLLVMAMSTIVTPLGRVVRPEVFAKIRNLVIIVSIVICLGVYLGVHEPASKAWEWIKSDGRERVKDVLHKDPPPSKATDTQQKNTKIEGVVIVSSDRPESAANLCPQWTKVPPNGRVALVDFPPRPKGDTRDWRFLIQIIGTIKIKDYRKGKIPLSGNVVRRVDHTGGQVYAYGNGRNTAQVKIRIL